MFYISTHQTVKYLNQTAFVFLGKFTGDGWHKTAFELIK